MEDAIPDHHVDYPLTKSLDREIADPFEVTVNEPYAFDQVFEFDPAFPEYDVLELDLAVSRLNVPVLAGQVVLKSVGMARFMNTNVAGVEVPERLIDELKKDKEATKSGRAGARICAEFLKEAKQMCAGAHLMTLGWERLVPEIVEAAGLA